jgi:hypothetical protein
MLTRLSVEHSRSDTVPGTAVILADTNGGTWPTERPLKAAIGKGAPVDLDEVGRYCESGTQTTGGHGAQNHCTIVRIAKRCPRTS